MKNQTEGAKVGLSETLEEMIYEAILSDRMRGAESPDGLTLGERCKKYALKIETLLDARDAAIRREVGEWIDGAQFNVNPAAAPDGNAPLHVVTVGGLRKALESILGAKP